MNINMSRGAGSGSAGKKISLFLGCLLALAMFGTAGTALAYNPTLSISNNGGDSFMLSVSGAYPNSSIQLNYTVQGSSLPTTITNFGTTDSNGYYSTTVSSSSYGLTGGAQVYVTVGGQQSNIVTVGSSSNYGGGCGYYGCTTGGLTLSQTSVNVNVGQTTYVTANYPYPVNNYSNNFYISSNSNSSVVTPSVSGNQISFYGLAAGSATVSICGNSSSQCASVYVTVGGGTSGCGFYGCSVGGLTLSQNNLSLTVGQSASVTVSVGSYIYSGSYYISSNSNSSVATASVSGSQINVYGQSSGSTSIYICQNSSSSCVTLYVTVSGVLGANTNLWFSPGSPNLYIGQSLAVSVNSSAYNNSYGGVVSPYYSISSNSNPGAVSANISGTALNLYAIQAGSSNITVCNTALGFCGTLTATVGGGGSGGSLLLSPSSLSLYVGQSATVTSYNSYGGSSLYVSSNSNSAVATASVSGNSVYVYGTTVGSTTLNICSNSNYGCANLYVTVGSGYYGGGYSGGNIVFTPGSLSLTLGQSGNVTVSGSYSYNFTISSNSSPTVASAVMQNNNNILTVTGTNAGYTTFSICQTGTSQFGNLGVTVSGYGYYGGGYGGSGNLSLSQTSLNLNAGQNATVYATNYSGSNLYVYSNSNPSVVSASVSGGTVYLNGLAAGSSSIYVCANNCVTLSVTVGGGYYGGSGGNLSYPGTGSSVLGVATYTNGQLISENGTVYIVYKNTKTGFVSASVFKTLGFNFGNVIEVGNSGLADSGYVVRTAAASHPWGTWVKSGMTVYFVHESGLIPVPNMNTLASNGGDNGLVVPANIYDLHLPMLSVMVVGDGRLQ